MRRLKREGTYVHLERIHAVVQQKPKEHCKAVAFQLKIKQRLREFTVSRSFLKRTLGISLVVQQLRIHLPIHGDMRSTSEPGTMTSHAMGQLNPNATRETQCS